MEETKVVDQLSPLEHGSRAFSPGGYTSVSCYTMFFFYCEDEQNYSILLCAKKYFKMTVLSE